MDAVGRLRKPLFLLASVGSEESAGCSMCGVALYGVHSDANGVAFGMVTMARSQQIASTSAHVPWCVPNLLNPLGLLVRGVAGDPEPRHRCCEPHRPPHGAIARGGTEYMIPSHVSHTVPPRGAIVRACAVVRTHCCRMHTSM